MHRFAYSFGLLLASFILSDARHTVFISHTGAKTFLPTSSESDVCMTPTCVIAAADILTSLDETVDPCDDFYRFACGGWMKRNELLDDQNEIHLFVETQNELDRKLRDLLEREYKSSEPPFAKMLKDFYNTCADSNTIEKQGSDLLRKMLNRLGGGWPVVEGSQWDEAEFDWVDTMITFRKLGYHDKILLDLYVQDNSENETAAPMLRFEEPSFGSLQYTANLSLGLEDDVIAAYYRAMVQAAKLLGAEKSTAEKEMLQALLFQLDLIKIISEQDLREKRNETEITIKELQDELPQVPWLKIINGLLLINQVDENLRFINGNPEYLVKIADLITSTDKRVIANYMLSRAVLESKEFLSEEWSGIDEKKKEEESSKKNKRPQKPWWKKCVKQVEEHMEIALTSYYVRHYFSDESQDQAMEMMKYIRKEFLNILENNDWMDEKTRDKAEEKANAIKAYIGYPKALLNDTFVMKMYENVTITTDSHLENILRFKKQERNEDLSMLKNNFIDMKHESSFDDLIDVNAYYSPWENSIAIPVGILHDAFYDSNRPEYMNFAAIGYIIGHEITHGFDNYGRKFDKDGKPNNWWDKETDEHFNKKVKCIIDQYDNYTTDIGMKVNGELTQNENIADNGGLKEAYLAFQSWTKDHGIEPLLPGVNYNQNQTFWLSAAHVWCAKYQPERLKEMLAIDSHSPGKFRIIGPMSNLAEFSKDFQCSPDAPMNRKVKCEVW